jgi:PEP-CTERM motif
MTTRNLVNLSMGLLLSLVAAHVAIADTVDPGACPTSGTYQDLLNTDTGGGCTISVGPGVSLTFSDFTFTPSGVGTPSAGGVTYTLDDPGVGSAGQPIFGFELNPGLTVTGTPANPTASQDIMLSYLVVPTGTAVNSVDLLQNATATAPGVGQVSENLMFCIASDPDNTSGTCRTFPGNPVVVSTSTGLPDHVTFGNWTSMLVSEDINANSGGLGGSATISGVQDAVDLSVVPEPTTYGLLSIGLLAIGYFSRRRRAH